MRRIYHSKRRVSATSPPLLPRCLFADPRHDFVQRCPRSAVVVGRVVGVGEANEMPTMIFRSAGMSKCWRMRGGNGWRARLGGDCSEPEAPCRE